MGRRPEALIGEPGNLPSRRSPVGREEPVAVEVFPLKRHEKRWPVMPEGKRPVLFYRSTGRAGEMR